MPSIGTCFRFYTQMRVQKKTKAFAYKTYNSLHNSESFGAFLENMNFNTLLFLGGVIGSKMPRFCLFGETINLASRMESHGEPGRIQISTNTKTLLELTEAEGYRIEPRGSISIKVYIFSIEFSTLSVCVIKR